MLNIDTVMVFVFSIYISCIGVMIYVRKHFKLKYSGYSSFFVYFVFSLVSAIFCYLRMQDDLTIWRMLSLLMLVVSKFFLMTGFLSFLNERFSKRFYSVVVVILSFTVHMFVILELDVVYYNILILIHNLLIHVYILYRVTRKWHQIEYGKQLVLILNSLFIFKVLIMIGLSLHNYVAEDFVFQYSVVRITFTSIMSLLLFVTILNLFMDIMYKGTKATNNRLKLAQLISGTGSWEIDLETNKVYASDVAFQIYELENIDGTIALEDIQSMVDKKDRDKLDRALHNLIHYNEPYDVIFKLHTNGKEKFIHSRASVEYLYGKPSTIVGVFVDVTNIKKKEDQLTYISYHDALTGLYNRRYYEEKITEYTDKDKLPLSIIVIDINGLKLMNDAFGHHSGDKLLVLAAKAIEESLDESSFSARIGGDEFIIILPNCNFKTAEKKANEILLNTKKYEVNDIQLSFALGVGTRNSLDERYSNVFKTAEDDMYRMKMLEVPSMRSSTIDTILSTLYENDRYSEEHSRAVSKISVEIARKMNMSFKQINDIRMAGILHDIGKIITSRHILRKDGVLTNQELEEMKRHPETGYRILKASAELEHLADIVLNHHEWWNGEGYPNGRKEEEIPILARVIAVADVFDAMTSQRTYRETVSYKVALEEITKCSGTQFDPKVVEVFKEYFNDIVDSN